MYCHPFEGSWSLGAEILEVRGRPAILWQTQKTARAANPGARVPRHRALTEGFTTWVDTRERYPYRFGGREVTTERAGLHAGDYAVRAADGDVLAAVERKSMGNLASSLSDGTLAFQMSRLGELPLGAVVVEGMYSALHKLEHVPGAFIADVLTRLQVRYPQVQVLFADTPEPSPRTGPTGSSPPRSQTPTLPTRVECSPTSDRRTLHLGSPISADHVAWEVMTRLPRPTGTSPVWFGDQRWTFTNSISWRSS